VTSTETLLKVEALQVRYGQALALRDVSLTVGKGDVVAVLGSNGAGKSTLARTISGLVPAVSGTITFDGQDITKWPAHRVRRSGIVYLPEGRGIFPALTVTENIQMASDLLPRAQRRPALAEAMDLFPNLATRRSNRAGLLSGGEQQMLSLARGLVTQPTLIIADEMSLGLAPKMVDMVFDSLGRLKAAGVTMIIIEQFVHRALAFADQCVLLSRGEVAWHGAPGGADQEILARYLGESAAASSS
jgi:branched-chain amino acid transport system ATP-binding protein